MRRLFVAAVLCLCTAPAFAQSNAITYSERTLVTLYRGTNTTTKVGDFSSWDACLAEAKRLEAQSTATSGTQTYNCRGEVRRVTATYAPATQPPPPPPPLPLTLTCPANLFAQAPDANGVAVIYTTPLYTGGTTPITVSSTPASGSLFSVGTTTVLATARDAVGVTASCSFTVTVSAPVPSPVPDPTPTSSALFENGWDKQRVLGCIGDPTFNLMDNRSWNDYGGPGACGGTTHDADVVNDVTADGGFALRVTQKPGNQNGTDFRILRNIGVQSSVTITTKLRYSANYKWAGNDHKIHIAGKTISGGVQSQDIYTNFRGGFDEKHGRICVHVIPSDVVFCEQDPARNLTVNRWYQLATYIVSGPQGTVEVYLKDCGAVGSDASCAQVAWTKLNLTLDAGRTANINSLNTGAGVDYFKLDTTYNLGSFITENMYAYYDSVKVYRGLVLP